MISLKNLAVTSNIFSGRGITFVFSQSSRKRKRRNKYFSTSFSFSYARALCFNGPDGSTEEENCSYISMCEFQMFAQWTCRFYVRPEQPLHFLYLFTRRRQLNSVDSNSQMFQFCCWFDLFIFNDHICCTSAFRDRQLYIVRVCVSLVLTFNFHILKYLVPFGVVSGTVYVDGRCYYCRVISAERKLCIHAFENIID